MGLDLVELVIRTEEEFGVQIPDAVAANLITPRNVIDYLTTELNTVDRKICTSQQAFYFLRKFVLPQTSIARHSFRPQTSLDSVFSKKVRSEAWKICVLKPVSAHCRICNALRIYVGLFFCQASRFLALLHQVYRV